MPTLHLDLTDEESARLSRLAARRQLSPETCIRDMIRHCFPDGSGWTHPAEGKSTIQPGPDVALEAKP